MTLKRCKIGRRRQAEVTPDVEMVRAQGPAQLARGAYDGKEFLVPPVAQKSIGVMRLVLAEQ